MGEEGKHQTSSLLLLLPPHSSEELVEPWHCLSSPLAPRCCEVCCSQRAAQKEVRGERLECKTSMETALQWELDRARTQVWASLQSRKGSGTGRTPVSSHGLQWSHPCTPKKEHPLM